MLVGTHNSPCAGCTSADYCGMCDDVSRWLIGLQLPRSGKRSRTGAYFRKPEKTIQVSEHRQMHNLEKPKEIIEHRRVHFSFRSTEGCINLENLINHRCSYALCTIILKSLTKFVGPLAQACQILCFSKNPRTST